MRQAGRYLPEYRKIKKKYSLEQMFQTPPLAAEITCLPVDILNVDAAILFADILTLPASLGFDIHFDGAQGPVIQTSFETDNIHPFEDLEYLREAIELINQQLPPHIPLIGFAGSPFTVATYLIEGGSAANYFKTLRLMSLRPEKFSALMDLLTENTVRYLNLQKQAGIKAFQLFDTWAGILRAEDFNRWVLPSVQKIFKEVDLPSIYYVKNCRHLLPLMDFSGADFLSVCHTVTLGQDPVLEHIHKGVQGNLYNGLLYADDQTLRREVNNVLVGGQKYERYIFNLSHGVFPDVDVNQLKKIVDQAHSFKLTRP